MRSFTVTAALLCLALAGAAIAQDTSGTTSGSDDKKKNHCVGGNCGEPGSAMKSLGLKRGEAHAQEGKGEDTHIKEKSLINKTSAAGQKAPTGKQEGKDGRAHFTDETGTQYCEILVDNFTPWIVQIVVDGTVRGAVGPFGAGTTVTLSGPTQLYARADFDDDTYRSWGPAQVSCGDRYYWALRK